jgi:hypothetical protein
VAVPVRRHRALRTLRRAGPGLTLAAAWLVVTTVGPWADTSISDLYVYSVYADLLGQGLTPYADFPFEYPPLALVPIGLLGGDELAFGIGMLACAIGVQEAARALGGERAAWLVCLLPLLAGTLVRTRFDLLPALLALAGLAVLAARHPGAAGVLLGLGALAKLWPGLLVLVGLVWLGDRRDAARLLAGAGTVVAVGVVAVVAVGGAAGAWESVVRFHLDRPVQIESVPATVLFTLGDAFVTGFPVRPDRFKSNGLDGGGAGTVAALAAVAQLAVLTVVVALTARRRDADGLLLGALGAVLAFVVLGKVLSPQFLLWLLPLAAVLGARGHLVPAGLIALAAAATLAYFPGRYFDLVAEDPLTISIVAFRNLLLLAALGTTVRALARSRRPASAASSGPRRP